MAQDELYPPPVADPASPHTFADLVEIYLTVPDLALGAVIMYDTNAGAPTYDLVYTGPIKLTASGQIHAFAQYPLGNSDSLTFTYTKNERPTASIIRPTEGQVLRSGSSFGLTASASDPEGNLQRVTYQYWDRGWVEIGYSAAGPTFPVDWVPSIASAYRLRAIARDAADLEGVSDEVRVTVTEPNQPPTCDITYPVNGSAHLQGIPISIAATANDTDLGGGVARVEFFHRAGRISTDAQGPYTASFTPAAAGLDTLWAVAYDNNGLPGTSARVGIVINAPPPPNQRPVVTSLVASAPGPFTAPAAFTLTANASDSDGTVAYVQFYRGGTFMLRATAAPFTYPVTNLAAGTHAFTARAFDDDGDSSAVSAPVNIVVSANQAPTASTGKDTAIVQPANTITLDGSASSDPENGTNLLYAWTAPAGVTFSNAATAKPTATLNSVGDYPITLTVTDRGNPPLSDSQVIRVSVHSTPVITSPLAATLNAGSPFSYTMTATGYPAPGFSVGAKPAWLIQSGNTLSGTAPATGGPAAVTFTAANAAGNQTRTLNLTIRQPPRITRDMPDSLVMQEGWLLVMSVEATGSPAPTYQWQIVQANGTAVNIGGNSASHTINPLSLSHSGTYRVIVSNNVNPPDTGKHWRLIVKQAILITSQPKGVSAQVGRNATLQVRATGSPPLYYQWFRGNTALRDRNTRDSNLIIPSVAMADAGLYRVRVTNNWTIDSVPSTFKLSDTARISVTLPKIDRPKTTPASPFDYGREGPSLTVRIHTDTPFTYIRYTTDGTNPTATYGVVYDTARKVVLTRTTAILKIRAFRDNYQPSDMYTGTFNYVEPSRAAKPTAWPEDGLFGPDPQLCSLRTSTSPGGVIRYTLNGSDPRTSPNTIYTQPFLLTANTTVTAYASVPEFTDSDTLVKVYTLRRIVQTAQAPVAAPPDSAFTDSIRITLSSATDSATIFYTLDGSDPESSPARLVYSGAAIVLRESAELRSVATRPNWNSSPISANAYVRIPGPIAANPAPKVFEGQVTVSLSASPADARIYYTLNDSVPLDDRMQPIDQAFIYSSPFVLDSTRTVTAVAIRDSVISKVFRFAYTRKGGPLNTPVVSTGDRPYSFKDSLQVTLRGVQDETIRYTLNGSPPNESSPAYTSPLSIDTTTTLQAIAYHAAFQPSKVLVATFTLVADTPSANPPGGDYGSTRNVILTAASRKTPIRYTVDGSMPGPDQGILYRSGESIVISRPTELRAVAFAGGVPGPMRIETYNIFGAIDVLLGPGETFFLAGGYTITNPVDQSVSVRVQQGSADSLILPGFKDVQYSLTLGPDPAAAPVLPADFPDLVLARSASDSRGVYRVTPEGRIFYISGAAMVTLGEAGTYFMGTDTATPVITYLGETLDDTGATLVRFKVEDNVFNLLHNAKRSDNPSANVSDMPVFSGSGLEFRLKHPAGSLKALNLQLSVTDYRNVAFCPPGGQSFLALSQKLTNVNGPEIWRIGLDRAKPYDLVGIPVQLNPPLTVADFGDPKSGVQVEAYVYVNPPGGAGPGTWRKLGQAEAVVPGQSYWLGSRTRVKGFRRAAAITAAQGLRKFTVSLRPGWNQIANPHLEPLYWPFPRSLDARYTSSPVKGLWAYVPESPAIYLERDVLEPWQGYYVYNYGRDTLIELASQPLAKAASRHEGAASPFRASLSLSFGDAPAVRLGATLDTRDALGHEDESVLPSLEARQALRAVRQGRGLSVDLIRFQPEGILQWRILPRLAPGAAPAAGSLPAMKVLARSLPEGYEAWAISRAREMKFKLSEGDSLPVSGLPDDTLIVAAGPAAKLAEWDLLKRLAEEAPDLDLRVGSRAGLPEFRLDLPAPAHIRATVWSLRGTSLGGLDRTLSAGRYRFTYADFRGGQPQPSPGVHFLRVEIRSEGKIRHLARKIVFRP